jgi:hypothetical protein
MNNDGMNHQDGHLVGNLHLGIGLYINMVLALATPTLSEAVRRRSIYVFDMYETGSIIVVPFIIYAIARYVYSSRMALFRIGDHHPRLIDMLQWYKNCYVIATTLLCLYHIVSTIIVSPGSPIADPGLRRDVFMVMTAIYIAMYGVFLIGAEVFLRKAVGMLRGMDMECKSQPS